MIKKIEQAFLKKKTPDRGSNGSSDDLGTAREKPPSGTKKTKNRVSEFSLRKRSSAKKKTQQQIAKEAAEKERKEKEEKRLEKERRDAEEFEQLEEEEKLMEEDREGRLDCPMHMMEKTPEKTTAFEVFAREMFALGVQGLLKEYAENLRGYVGHPAERVIFDQNATKNRYKDVICNDLTRVPIADGRGNDYIHANFVRGEPLFNEFILTQGPMPSTREDFWRMVWFYKIVHVVMLCDTIETGKVKCVQYWPQKEGDRMLYRDMMVSFVSINAHDTNFVVTKLMVTQGSESLTLRHYHWKSWPDRGIPYSSKATLRLLRIVRYSRRPIVVHCSAGIGRTGTFVAVEMCIQSLMATGTVNLLDVCRRLRNQRLGVLQVDSQFVYLALAVLEFGRVMNFIENPELIEGFKSFKAELLAIAGPGKKSTPEKRPPSELQRRDSEGGKG